MECGTPLPDNPGPAAGGFEPMVGNDAMVAGDVIGRQEVITAQNINIVHNYRQQDAPVEYVLKVRTDAPCRIHIDGEYNCNAGEGKTVRLILRKGTYMLEFISTQTPEDRHTCEYRISDPEESLVLPLKGIWEKERLMQERYYTTEPAKLTEDEWSEALSFFRSRAQKGDPVARYKLGLCHGHGYCGVQKNETEAVRYYSMAAQQGYACAQYALGVCYAYGRGVAADSKESAKWYLQAAENGNMEAQCEVGWSYYIGSTYFPKDRDKAIEWHSKAAAQGYGKSQAHLGSIYFSEKNYKEAIGWFLKAIEHEPVSDFTYTDLGLSYIYTGNNKEAQRWFERVKSPSWYVKGKLEDLRKNNK